MRRSGRVLAFLGLAAILGGGAGCFSSSVAHLRTDDAPNVPAANVPPEAVIVFPFANIGRPYDILGVVIAAASSGDATGDRTHAAYARLQKEAAALGADAVIDASMEVEYGYAAFAVKVSGMAVRLR